MSGSPVLQHSAGSVAAGIPKPPGLELRDLESSIADLLRKHAMPPPPHVEKPEVAMSHLAGFEECHLGTLGGMYCAAPGQQPNIERTLFERNFFEEMASPCAQQEAALLQAAAESPAVTEDTNPLLDDDACCAELTTVMVRHVPPKFTQPQLAKEVNDLGFHGKFDFLYIPMDSRRRANRGIAFINFFMGVDAKVFARAVHGRPLSHPCSQRPVEVRPADLQGFERNVAHHMEALCSRTDLNKPLFFRHAPVAERPRGKDMTKVDQRNKITSAKRLPHHPGVVKSQVASIAGANVGGTVDGLKEQQQPQPTWLGFCLNCGLRRRAEHAFCPSCGTCFLERF